MKKVIIGLSVVLVIVVLLTIALTLSRRSSETRSGSGATPSGTVTPAASKPKIRIFTMYVKNWVFDPNVIRIKKGDTIELHLKSLDVKHGFSLPAYDLNVPLDPFQWKVVTFTATKAGQFVYTCTINCSPKGYPEMKGVLIVE